MEHSVSLLDKQGVTVRNSSIELLRIISMIFIIAHHYSVHGDFELSNSLDLNTVWVRILLLGGKWGVTIFVLISGYFLVNSTYSPKKALKFVLQVEFYSVVCFLSLIFAKIISCSSPETFLKELLKSLLPIPYNQYWFATTYFLMFVLSPYINACIKSITEKQHLKIILFLTVVWSILPMFMKVNFNYNALVWFIYLYLVASYIRLYPKKIFSKTNVLISISIVSYILMMLLVIISNFVGNKYQINFLINISVYFPAMNSILVLISAVSIFIAFLNIKLQSNFINKVASATFGIYLIHDNTYIRLCIWKYLFKSDVYFNTQYFVIHSIVTIAIIFVVCSIIELLRIKFLEKWSLDLVYKYYQKLKCFIVRIFESKFLV